MCRDSFSIIEIRATKLYKYFTARSTTMVVMVVDLAEEYFLNYLMEKVLEGSTFIVENNIVDI